MSDRGGVRSSARLSGDSATPAPSPACRGRPVSSAAAAALRRARAAERAAEVEDSPRVLRDKCRRLARALRNAKHLVMRRCENDVPNIILRCVASRLDCVLENRCCKSVADKELLSHLQY